MTRTQRVGITAVVALAVLAPVPTTITSNFTLEPIRRAVIRPPAPGVVHDVLVETGEHVRAGQTLALIASPTLEEAQVRDESRLAAAQRALLTAESTGDQTAVGQAEQQRRRAEADLASVRAKLSGLALRSVIGGVVTTPQVSQKTGLYLQEGETFAVVANQAELKAQLLVIDRNLQFVRKGAEVKLKLNAFPFRTFTGHVARIMPAAAASRPIDERLRPKRYGLDLTNYFAVVVTLPNRQGLLREGMTGEAKIYSPARPIAWQAGNKLWRWVRSLAW